MIEGLNALLETQDYLLAELALRRSEIATLMALEPDPDVGKRTHKPL